MKTNVSRVQQVQTGTITYDRIGGETCTHVSADFCRPFPRGDYLLVVVDDYSRFPVVEIFSSLTAR